MMKKLLLISLVYVLLINPSVTRAYSFIDALKQLKSNSIQLRGQLKGEALTDAMLTIKLSASNPAAQMVAPDSTNVKIAEYEVTASNAATLDRFLTSYSQYQPSGQPPQPQATSELKIYIDGVPLTTDPTEYKAAHTFAIGQTKKLALYMDVLPAAMIGIQFFGSITGVASASNPGITTTWAGLTAGNLFTVGTPIRTGPIKYPPIVLNLDTTPRIEYWGGKVNQHVDKRGVWLTDPDGTSGANIDKLTYCKKWYPETTAIKDYKMETISGWRNAGNTGGPFTETFMSTACVKGEVPVITPYITILSPNGGELYKIRQDMKISWNSQNLNPDMNTRIYLIYTPNNIITTIGNGPVGALSGNGFNYTIPSQLETMPGPLPFGKYYKIKVNVYDSNQTLIASDSSDQEFSINSNEVINDPTTCPTNGTPSIKVVSPNGGEIYNVSDQVKILWQTLCVPVNANMQVDIMDDRIQDWTTRSLFGTSPVLNYAKLISSAGNKNTYEYDFTLPNNFNNSLPEQYQGIFGGNHYKINALAVVSDQSGTPSQVIVRDRSDNNFTINSIVTNKFAVNTNNIDSSNPNSATFVGEYLNSTASTKTWFEWGAAHENLNNKTIVKVISAVDSQFKDTITIVPGTSYYFRACAQNSLGTIICGNVINFVSGGTTTTPCSTTGTPIIKIISPKDGEIYQSGQSLKVKWSSCGFSTTDNGAISIISVDNQYPLSLSVINDGEENITIPVVPKSANYNFVIKFDGSQYAASDSIQIIINPSPTPTNPRLIESNDINQTGQDRMATTPTIYIPSNRTLRVGVKGEDVKSLQSYFNITVDGVYGKGTAAKVKEWQRGKGLKADGVFGEISRVRLGMSKWEE